MCPRRKLARLLKRVYHGCGTGKRALGRPWKNALTSISPWDWGGLFWYVFAGAMTGDLWVVFRTIAHVPVSRLQDPDDSRVLVPSGPLAIFKLQARFICSQTVLAVPHARFQVHCWRA